MTFVRRSVVLVAALAVVAGSAVAAAPVGRGQDPLAAPGAYTAAGAMAESRMGHTATLLGDGRVVILGGAGGDGRYLASVETWDPATNGFAGGGTLREGRGGHTATLLADGRVLLVGGGSGSLGENRMAAEAELWDPATGASSPAGTPSATRSLHTATVLADGRVLVIGGFAGAGELRGSAELWDPATGTFAPAGELLLPRYGHTATLRSDGRVHVVGGVIAAADGFAMTAETELWDPANAAFAPGRPLVEGHGNHTATQLPDGRLLVIGGFRTPTELAGAEVSDLFSGAFMPTGSMALARTFHSAVALPDGRVLVIGGRDLGGALTVGEQWDPATGTFAPAAPLPAPREAHQATLLADGRVLVTGHRREADAWSP